MWAALLAVHGHGYGHGHSGGWSHLFSTIAHAAIWSTVGRLIWHAPALAVVAAVVIAGGYLVVSRRRRS